MVDRRGTLRCQKVVKLPSVHGVATRRAQAKTLWDMEVARLCFAEPRKTLRRLQHLQRLFFVRSQVIIQVRPSKHGGRVKTTLFTMRIISKDNFGIVFYYDASF
jgi:hypothetical protein